MIDVRNAKWNFSKEEKYAIDWLNKNGFTGELKRQYIGKTIFLVEKDGVSDKLEVQNNAENFSISKFMNQFEVNWNALCELVKLRQQAKNLK